MLSEHLIINLLLILVLAWLFGAFFAHFGLPVMLGQLLAGLLLGPSVLGFVEPSSSLDLLADFGIFFAMFYAGMEMNPRDLLKHIWPSLAVAVGGFVLPFILGYLVATLFGATVFQALFVGLGLSITAIAVQAVVLQDLRVHRSRAGNIILGAAIADDILSLIVLSVLLGLAQSGTVPIGSVIAIIVKVALFFFITILIGHFVIPIVTSRLDDVGGKGFTFALVSALIMSYMAELAGLHLVIGAFLAGQFVRKEIMDDKIYHAISDRLFGITYGFLMPIFFATLAFHVHFVWDLRFLLFTVALIGAAIFGKLAGCGVTARAMGYGSGESLLIGIGMNGRGAVELVVIAVVIELSDRLLATRTIGDPLLTADQVSGLVLMAFVTTLLALVLLRWSVGRSCSGDEKEPFCQLRDDPGRPRG